MSISTEPTTSVSVWTSRASQVSQPHICAHCHAVGTTACGALWRVAPAPEPGALYYLHTRCLDPYRLAQGLRSAEGRVPLAPCAHDAPAATSPTSAIAATVDTTAAAS